MDHKPTVTITATGVAVFWISLFAIPVGISIYSGPILFPGIMGLVLILAARFLSGRQLKNLRLLRRLPKRGFPGETFEVETRIENQRTRLVSREVTLDDKLAGHGGRGVSFPEVAPGCFITTSYPAKVFQRGRLGIPQFKLTSNWPFGFFEASTTGEFEPAAKGHDTMLVAPKPVIPTFVDRILQQIEQEAVLYSELNPDDRTEFRSLREFRSGDSLKSIHWPASSRSESIIVREFDPPLPKPQCHGILLHQYVPHGELYQPDRFEKMLRIASGLLVRFWQRELPVVVRIEIGDSRVFHIPLDHHYHQVLDALAEVQSAPASSLQHFEEGWEIFEDCDQVFVLGDSERSVWQARIEGCHPAVICLDPGAGVVKKRTARTIKPTTKVLTK